MIGRDETPTRNGDKEHGSADSSTCLLKARSIVRSLRLGNVHEGGIAPDVLDAAVLIVEAQEIHAWGLEPSAESVGLEDLPVILAVARVEIEDMDNQTITLPVRIGVIRRTDSSICYAAFTTNSRPGGRQFCHCRNHRVCPFGAASRMLSSKDRHPDRVRAPQRSTIRRKAAWRGKRCVRG